MRILALRKLAVSGIWLGQTRSQQPHSIQSVRQKSRSFFSSSARAYQSSCCGNSRTGHTEAQSPQRIQGNSSPGLGASETTRTQLLAFTKGISSVVTDLP